MTPCMEVYKAKIQSDGSLEKLKVTIVVRGELHNRDLIGDTWSPAYPTRNLKHFFGRCYQAQVKSTLVIFYLRIITGKS